MQSPIMPLPSMAARLGAKSRTWYVCGNKTTSGFADSMTCFNATEYPSGVYASSKSCSTLRTSATFFAASSFANAATPFPITSALTALDVSLEICCAAANVSKLALFHLPCRCSVTTRIFIACLFYPFSVHSGQSSVVSEEEEMLKRDLRFLPLNTDNRRLIAFISRALQISTSRPASLLLPSECRSGTPSSSFSSARKFFQSSALLHAKHRVTRASSSQFPFFWPP